MPESEFMKGIIDQLEAKRLDLIEDALMTMPDHFRAEYKEVVDAIARLKATEELLAQMPPVDKPAASPAPKPARPKRAQSKSPRERGVNSREKANQNQQAVVSFLREHPNSTQVEIINGSGVARGSMTAILKRGLDQGVLVPAGERDGRPLYSLPAEPAVALAAVPSIDQDSSRESSDGEV
jgi:hypothetical protein